MASQASDSVEVRTKSTLARRINAGNFPFLLIAPSIIIILIITGFPLLYSLYVSLTPYELLKPNSLSFEFTTAFRNYLKLSQDDIFWRSLWNTIIFLAVTVNLSYIISLALSQLLARVTVGTGIMRTMLMVPMMFAPILVGFQFRWFFNADVGLVNNFLLEIGLLQEQGQIAWLVDVPLGMITIITASIWMNIPVIFEAAEVDGSNAWQQFRHISFPLLQPFSYIALTILSLDISRAFDIVRMMTDGGPAHRTEVIWTYVTRLAIEDTKFGLGSAMSFVTVLLSVLFTLYFFRQLVRTRVVE